VPKQAWPLLLMAACRGQALQLAVAKRWSMTEPALANLTLSLSSAVHHRALCQHLRHLKHHCGVHNQQADIEEVDAQPSAAPAPPSVQLAGMDAAALEATILHTVRFVLPCNGYSAFWAVQLPSQHQACFMRSSYASGCCIVSHFKSAAGVNFEVMGS
jgi:hypothetical protein